MALGWLLNLALGGTSAVGISATVTGSVSDGATEQEIFKGTESIVITLTGSTWNSGIDFDRQAIIDGLTSAQNELNGWNNEVRDKLIITAVERGSDTTVHIFLPAFSGYDITATETITVTVPASATSESAITATPTFSVTASVLTGTEVVNTDAEIPTNSGYEICDRSGFKMYPFGHEYSELREEWTGYMVRMTDKDTRNAQEYVRSTQDPQPGPQNPEASEDSEVGTVSASDL